MSVNGLKKGINMYALPYRYTLEQSFKMISEAGFDGVEINLDEKKRDDGTLWFHTGCTASDLAEIKNLAGKYNLELISMISGSLWANPITSNDPAVRERGSATIRLMIDFASELKIDTILVVPGRVDENIHYDNAYENALDALDSLKKYAEEKKVIIGIENVWNKFLLSPLEMRDYIDKLHSDYIGAYFDIGNVVINSFPEQWIKILNSRIKRLHAKGFARGTYSFVNLLEGDVNWQNVMNEIKKTGYKGFVTAELGSYNEKFTMNLLNETSKAFDSIFAL